jgi:hypothetical protein
MEAGEGEDELAAIADYLVDESIGVRQGLRSFWDYHWAMALAGKIPDHKEYGLKLRALLELGGPALADAAVLARLLADRSHREVARLIDFESQAKAFPLWVEECMARWEMLDRPHKPLDRGQVARSREAFRRGECENAGHILRRMEHTDCQGTSTVSQLGDTNCCALGRELQTAWSHTLPSVSVLQRRHLPYRRHPLLLLLARGWVAPARPCGTLGLPGETEAGSAGAQPAKG